MSSQSPDSTDKSVTSQSSIDTEKVFLEFIKIFPELSENRSDGVSITAIVGLVLSFMTMIVIVF